MFAETGHSVSVLGYKLNFKLFSLALSINVQCDNSAFCKQFKDTFYELTFQRKNHSGKFKGNTCVSRYKGFIKIKSVIMETGSQLKTYEKKLGRMLSY